MTATKKETSEPSKKKRTRSRLGCHNCKRLKVKCDEEKPSCTLCLKSNKKCDYSIQLTWGGRPFKKKKNNNYGFATISTFQQEYDSIDKGSSKSPTSASDKEESSPQITIKDSLTPKAFKAVKHEQPVQTGFPSPNIFEEHEPKESSATVLEFNALKPLESDYMSGRTSPSPDTSAKINYHHSEIFRDIATTNIAAKEFLNDCIIPELVSFENNNETYAGKLSPRITELEENSEELFDNESVVSRSLFSNISQVKDYRSPSYDPLLDDIHNPDNQKLLTGYEFIPFSILPLPDMLMKVPYFRESFHAYVEIYSKMIVPAPPSTYEDNPLTCIVPRMSVSSSSDGMLSVLIASSIVQGSHYRGEGYPREIVSTLIKRALSDLYNKLTDEREAESDYTLALVMMIACFEILCSNRYDWRSHYYGARKIMLSKGLLKAKNEKNVNHNDKVVGFNLGDESDISYFFARWFAYTDVIGSLSSSTLVNRPFSGNEIHLIWEAPEISEEAKLNLQDIDPFMGFDLRLLSYFAEIIKLVKERERNCPTVNFLSAPLIRKALEIKEEMSKFLADTDAERDVIVQNVGLEGDEKKMNFLKRYILLRATNRAFALAGILQIYRRILLMPNSSPLVQDMVSEITSVFRDQIPAGTPAACCTIYSLFTTGCDVLDNESRAFYTDRMRLLAKDGFLFGTTAYNLMKESWDTGKYWADLITEKNIDLTFV